jgi:hypothetical protein
MAGKCGLQDKKVGAAIFFIISIKKNALGKS